MRSDRTLVVLLPHPDDEFALFPFLREAVGEGRTVHLVWMTDGGAGGVAPERRSEESRAALAASGLQAVQCTFLGMTHSLPDGRLHQHLGRAREALAEWFATLDGPTEVWMPAWEGGHQDHDATHALGRAVSSGRATRISQYPTYNGAGRSGAMFRVLSPLPSMEVVERRVLGFAESLRLIASCLHYRSQWRSFLGLLPMIILHLIVFRRPMVLCAIDPASPLVRPHPEPLLYERRTPWRWDDLQSALTELR
jgi:hypothetical protein